MKLSPITRCVLAFRKEQRDMEAQGYYGHGITLSGNETIEDIKISKDGRSIWIKMAEQ